MRIQLLREQTRQRARQILIGLTFLIIGSISGQSLPTGFPMAEERLRVDQLLGRFDSTVSFAQRPLLSSYFQEVHGESLIDKGDTIRLSRPLVNKRNFKFSVLPAQWDTEITTHHPEGYNNGSLIRSRGVQTRIAGGIYAKWSVFSIQLRPELIWAQNADYDTFVKVQDSISIERRFILSNRIDLPDRYGEGTYRAVIPGQTSIRIDTKWFSAGLSSENIWWGPGQESSLLMTNNARGFYHLTLNSTQPADIWIGTLEGQFLVGRLDASGFGPTETAFDELYYQRPNDDWRYLSAVNLVYRPRWIPNLHLGLNRAFVQYWEGVKERNDYFPVLTGLFKTQRNDDRLAVEQLLSINGRYVWKKFQTETYFEWGRNDASRHFRDFLLGPNHSQAYIFGFAKSLETKKAHTLSVGAEVTHLERPLSHLLRATPPWYQHGEVTQGYTHRGEVLGAGIGPGSNSQSIKVARFKGLELLGVKLSRREVQQDLRGIISNVSGVSSDKWVDYTLAFSASKVWGKLLLYSELHFTASLNYQWGAEEVFPGVVTGNDAFNMLLRVRLSYL